MKNYSFGKIQLRKREIELIKLIKKYINEERNIYPVKNILAPNNNLMKGLRTNYIFYTSKVFKNYVNELASTLAISAGMKDPVLPYYGDLHSSFAVGWHRDSSGFKYDEPRHAYLFNEKKKCIKFYIRMTFSPLDLKVKDENNKVHRLVSNNTQIGFFDVRNLHATYITTPFFKKSKILSKILDKIHNSILTRIYNFFKGFETIRGSNLYFFVYEDCETWRNYAKREFERAEFQIKKDKEALDKFYAI